MFSKLLLSLCLLHVVQSGSWRKIADYLCIGSKDGQYREFTYKKPDTFIIAMKLVHRSGLIGCTLHHHSKWGCTYENYRMNIIVTDTRNNRIYPSKTQVDLRTGGWYELPGYGPNTKNIVFSDPGFRYLEKYARMRIWYGEDLYNWSERDNQGHTCMDVYVYSTTI